MIDRPTITLDPRDAGEIVRELLARSPGYVPEWKVPESGAGRALVEIVGRNLEAIAQRLNQAPEKNKLAFLDLLGLRLLPAQAARVPIVFQLSEKATASRVPANTQLAAPPPPERAGQVVFETERATGVSAAKLLEVVSLWPGRDQYIDHSAAFLAGAPIEPFAPLLLKNTPHLLYVAHDVLLSLAGKSNVNLTFELSQPGTKPLEIVWEYWDGKVWRGFEAARPACQGIDEVLLDGTAGLSCTGTVLLKTDCAETARIAINGVEAFWLRGRLDQSLPPDPATLLPEVESIKLGTTIERPLKVSIQAEVPDTESNEPRGATILVVNEAGDPIPGVDAQLTSPTVATIGRTNALGQLPSTDFARKYDAAIEFQGLASSMTGELTTGGDVSQPLPFVFQVSVEGLDPDKAFAGATKLDVSKPFYPFGQQPQPGATFYFTNEEVFTKPNARLQIYVESTGSPQDALDASSTASAGADAVPATRKATLSHLVSWEYWNGREWVALFVSQPADPWPVLGPVADLDTTEVIDLQVPEDMEKTKVNDVEALWMRVTLVRGSYGFANEVTWTNRGEETPNSFTYVVTQPPALSAFRLGYTWGHGPFPPEHVFTSNDFQFEDHTYEAVWPGATFAPFERIRDLTPALYLGFDQKLPVDRLGVFFDFVERAGETLGPAMQWEFFNGAQWSELSVEDETRNLRLPGILSFIGAEESAPLARFTVERHWLRGRLKEDGPPGAPVCDGIFPNAVWASQQQTYSGATLGTSTGQASQVFRFAQTPVLAGAQIEVRELSGPRANVEWRILARGWAAGRPRIVQEFEEMLGREGTEIDLVVGDLRLRRDRNKRVAEVWVRWHEQPNLYASSSEARHLVIDRASGRVFFGDGVRGKVPPAGATILAQSFRAGGGTAGNVPAGAIKQLLGGVAGVQSVFNPHAAEGGADGETLQRFTRRGPHTVRQGNRAITPLGYETLAKEASPAVAVAVALPGRSAGGPTLPGWVTLVIIPESKEPRPWPSWGLREQVRRYVGDRAPAGLSAARQLYVTGPDYVPIDLSATIAVLRQADAGATEQAAREAVGSFLHPLHGGPEGAGWEPGRDVFLSDVAAVLERVPGVDYVEELALLRSGALQGGSVPVPPGHVAAAGEIRLKLKSVEV
jgi:hypothetical protein